MHLHIQHLARYFNESNAEMSKLGEMKEDAVETVAKLLEVSLRAALWQCFTRLTN